MKRWTTWSVVAAMLALSAGLGACKSRARSRCNTCVAPASSACGAPGVAAVPQQSYGYDTPASNPNEFAATDYPPPPPLLQSEPVPSARQAELETLRDDAESARRRGDALERQLLAERESTQDAIRSMEDRLAQISDLQPPAGPAAQAPVFAEPRADAADRMLDDLRSNNVADVSREGDLIIVRYTNSFKAGSDKLRRDAQIIATLNATAEVLNRCNGASVAVVGHSDGDPIRKSPWPSNDALSLARAQRVAQVLTDNGVDQNRISIDGRGFREPLVNPEVGRADKARNRRVEIMIRL